MIALRKELQLIIFNHAHDGLIIELFYSTLKQNNCVITTIHCGELQNPNQTPDFS